MGVYIIIICLIATMTVTTACLRFPPMPKKTAPGGTESGNTADADESRWHIIGNFLSSKKFLIAMIAGSVSYAIMVLMMAPAPLAILGAGYTFTDQSQVILAHVWWVPRSACHPFLLSN